MKILVVTQYFWPETFRINDLAKAFRQRGHDMVVLTGFPNYGRGRFYPGYKLRLFQREVYEGVKVVRVPLYPDVSFSLFRRSWSYLSFMLSASILSPFLVGRIDRILVFQPGPLTVAVPGLVVKLVSRAPLFLWVQDMWPDTLEALDIIKSSFLLKVVRRFVSFIYRHSDMILVQSQGYRHRLASLGMDEEKIVYLPNWADDLYRPIEYDPELARKEDMVDHFCVVFAGNIGRAQDFDTLLAAAKLLQSERSLRLIILGDGSLAEPYIRQAQSENLTNVVFKGRKAESAIPQYFSLAGALLLLLKREPVFALTVPSKLQAYLACGRPIVAAVEGEAAEIVRQSGAGVVCEPGNPAALAEAVRSVHRLSNEQRKAMGQAGLGYFKTHFDRSMLLARCEAILASRSVHPEL